MEKGHGSDLPFSSGGAAYRPRSGPGAHRELPNRRDQGRGGGNDGYERVEAYEFCAAEYGWGPEYVEWHVTDEQLALYAEKATERKRLQAFASLDRLVTGTSWGTGIAFDHKGRNARKWQSIRRKIQPAQSSQGLTGAALEAAVMAIAAADSSLVKIERAS